MADFKPSSYQLQVLDQNYLPRALTPSDFIDAIQGGSALPSFYARQNSEIFYFIHDAHKHQWHAKARETLFKEESSYPVDIYPGYVANFSSTDQRVLILKAIEGICFQQFSESSQNLERLALDSSFHDVYDWNDSNHTIKFGQFFAEKNAVGVLTRSPDGVKFYQVSVENGKPDTSDPLLPFGLLNPDIVKQVAWIEPKTEFLIVDTRRRGQDDIVLRTNQGLKLFEFTPDYKISNFLETFVGAKTEENSSDEDVLLFADLTGQAYRDIVLWGTAGVAVFQFQPEEHDYALLSFSPEFALKRGWKREYLKSLKRFDLNGDGRDELLLSGPRGITVLSFNLEYNQWDSVLDNARLGGNGRYAHIVNVIPSFQNNALKPLLMLQDQETIRWVRVVEDEKPDEILEESEKLDGNKDVVSEDPDSTPDSHVGPDDAKLPKPIDKADLFAPFPVRLAEQLDYSPLMKAVNTLNGQLQFTLPLVELPVMADLAISLAVSYDDRADATLLGKSWSLTPHLSYITADFKGSIFEEDIEYYLINEGQMLVLNQTHSTEAERAFQIGNQTDTKISYLVQKECWQVEMPEETLTFGRTSDPTSSSAVEWGLAWPHWRGAGSDAGTQIPIAQTWYLSKRQVKEYNQAVHYQYESISATVPGGKSFTESVYLKTVSDGENTRLILNYAPKTNDEFDDPPLIDSKGIIQTSPRQRHYLAGYQVETRYLAQTVHFVYQIYSHQRYLSSIEQVFGDESENVLQFYYESVADELVLAKSTLPTGLEVHFSYQIRASVPLLDLASSYESTKDALIFQWSDYAVISSKDSSNRTLLEVLGADAADTSKKLSKVVKLPSLGRKDVQKCNIVPKQNFFLVELDYGAERDVYLYTRRQGVWLCSPTTMVLEAAALIKVSEDYIVVTSSDAAELTLFEWQEAGVQWKERSISPPVASGKPPRYIAVYERLIAVYDDAILWIGYRDREKEWRSQLIKEIPNWASKIQNVLQKFDLEKNTSDNLSEYLYGQGLQILNNFIVLSTIQLSSDQLASHIQVMLLNSSYQVFEENLYVLPQENVRDLSLEWKPIDDLRLALNYKKTEGGKFLVHVESGHQNETTLNEENLGKIREDLTTKGNNVLSKISLVDWPRYQVVVSSMGVRCGTESFNFTGNVWAKRHVPEAGSQSDQFSLRLGKYFILEKMNARASFKLYRATADGKKHDSPILDLMTSDAEKIVVGYPVYLAYQIADSVINFIAFRDSKTLGPSTELSGENLHGDSTFNLLITYPYSGHAKAPNRGEEKGKEFSGPESLILRYLSAQSSQRDQLWAVVKTTSRSGEQQRVVAYEYADSLNRTVGIPFYPKMSTIPGGEKSISGWCVETRIYNASPQQFMRHERFFNVHGEVVKESTALQEDVNNEDADRLFKDAETFDESAMLDKTGQRIIADCSPRLLKDEEVGYFGFESYEINRIGKAFEDSASSVKKWQYSDKYIIKQGFAFTGENYLHLDGTQNKNDTYFEGIFQPSQQDATYLASCWLRSSTLLELGRSVPYLKAHITTAAGEEVLGMLSQVKSQSGDWFYLEILIDLMFMKQVYLAQKNDSVTDRNVTSTTLSINKTLTAETEVILSILLSVGPSTGMTVDLDHVRFSPLEDAFQVKVYNPITNQHTAVILANGLVERTIYKRSKQPIAALGERGSISSLSSKSATGHLFPTPQGALASVLQIPSNVLFKPESGFYETFDAHALKSRWTLDDPDVWKTAQGRLRHEHSDWHKIQINARLLDLSSAALRFEVAVRAEKNGDSGL